MFAVVVASRKRPFLDQEGGFRCVSASGTEKAMFEKASICRKKWIHNFESGSNTVPIFKGGRSCFCILKNLSAFGIPRLRGTPEIDFALKYASQGGPNSGCKGGGDSPSLAENQSTHY